MEEQECRGPLVKWEIRSENIITNIVTSIKVYLKLYTKTFQNTSFFYLLIFLYLH